MAREGEGQGRSHVAATEYQRRGAWKQPPIGEKAVRLDMRIDTRIETRIDTRRTTNYSATEASDAVLACVHAACGELTIRA